MSLGVKLKTVCDYFVEQIEFVLEVSEKIYESMREEYKQIQEQLNSEDNRKKYMEYISIINQHKKSADGTCIYLSDDHQELHNLQTELNLYVPKLNHLLNMTLVYLLALLEGFNKKFFFNLFCYKTEMMKSNKKISYEELLEFNSIKAIQKYIAKEITDNYGNIDKIDEEINFKFNFSLSEEFEHWESLREVYYRRNIIIHNRSMISKIYLKKMNLPPESLNKKRLIDINYVISAKDILIKYIQFIFDKIKEKFDLDTSVRRFAPFPLRFDKPMIVKKGKDEIFDD